MTKTLLLACPSCLRHVRATEVQCPFCGSDVPLSFREQVAPASVGRLSRAALHALRAGALSMTAAACGGAVAGGTGRENNSSATFAPSYGGVPADASFAALYGGFIAEDAGPSDAGEMTDDATVNGGALYGGFFPNDAGSVEATLDAGDGGPTDASDDQQDGRVTIAPPYGTPPAR